MGGEEEDVTWARSKRGLRRVCDRSVPRAGARVRSQHQQIRFLQSQLLPDEIESIAARDRHHRSALAQSQSLDAPRQRLLARLLRQAGNLPSFSIWGERQGWSRNVVLQPFLGCVKKVEARLREEG